MISFRHFVEWAEGDLSRGRKVALFSVIFMSLFLTFFVFMACILIGPKDWCDAFFPYYVTFISLAGVAVGFYTGTQPKGVKLTPKVTDEVDTETKTGA